MMSHKTDPPVVLPGIVHRERLFNLLDRRAGMPLYWISGPGGSGKTTLVSSYLESRGIPALWYQVDAGDADPASFFYHLGEAFRRHVPQAPGTLPLLTPEYLAGLGTFTRHFFQHLFSHLPTPFVVVFDNYQEVSATAPFHALLQEGLSQTPDGITMMVLSRNEPPPVLTTRETALRTQHLGWNDLRFSFDETGEFAGTHTNHPIPPESLACLYSKTDGWIAGLLLILESLKGSDLDLQALDKLPLETVFNFFADKVFDASDPEMQTLLLKTAFAPGLTARMAEQLTGLESSEQILSRLCRNKFFTEMRSLHEPVYHYHPLFRQFLLARAEQGLHPLELRDLRRKASSLLREAGRDEDAALLLRDAADWEGLARLVQETAPLLASEGRYATLGDWLGAIPVEIVESTPGLLFWKGIGLLLQSPAESRVCFQSSFDLYAQAGERGGMLLSWSAGADVSLYDGNFVPLDHWLSLLDGTHPDDLATVPRQIEERVVMSVFNAMAFRQPHHPDLPLWRERAAALVRGDADINLRLQSAVHLLVHDLWTGNFSRASFLLDQAMGLGRSRSITPMTELTILNARVLHAFFTGEWSTGVALAVGALKMADETGVHVWDGQLLGNGASCALAAGDMAHAEEMLQGMERRLEWYKKPIDLGQYHGLRGWQEHLRGNFAAVSDHLELALVNFRAIGFRASESVAFNFLADHLRRNGSPSEAGRYLEEAHGIARGMGSGYLEFISLCNRVTLLLDDAQEDRAIDLLRRAMAMGSRGGYYSGWIWLPETLIRLCTLSLEHGIEVAYAQEMIRRWNLVPETPPLHLETWPWPLKILTMGGFQLVRFGEPAVIAGKVKKPLELLKALISLGGKGVAVESICDALWPDADGDLAQRSFDTTLHRLRKQLGCEKALQLQAGRLSLDPRFCWLDTWAFERLRGEVDEALKEGDGAQSRARIESLADRCASLYQGRFLPGDGDEPWTFPMRERMAGLFHGLMTRVGDHFASRGDWERAAGWYRRGLKEENLTEELRQRLDDCLQEQGKLLSGCG